MSQNRDVNPKNGSCKHQSYSCFQRTSVFAHSFMCVLSGKKSSLNSLTGAILPKVKDVLLWTNRTWRACTPLSRRVEVFIPLITTHDTTATIPHHNTHACVRLIPVIHQWTPPWSRKLISHQFIWLATVRERWAVCVCVCVFLCAHQCVVFI